MLGQPCLSKDRIVQNRLVPFMRIYLARNNTYILYILTSCPLPKYKKSAAINETLKRLAEILKGKSASHDSADLQNMTLLQDKI